MAQQQGQRVVAGDGVGLDREPQEPESVVEVVLPDRAVPFEEVLAAPDVVDEDVEAALLVRDAVDEGADLCGVEVVGGYGDALAAGLGDEVGGVLDGLGAVVLGAPGTGGAAGDVDRGAGRAEFHRDPPARATRRPGDQRDLALQRCGHVRPPVSPRLLSRSRMPGNPDIFCRLLRRTRSGHPAGRSLAPRASSSARNQMWAPWLVSWTKSRSAVLSATSREMSPTTARRTR